MLAEMQINNHKEIWNVRFHRQIGFLPHTHTQKIKRKVQEQSNPRNFPQPPFDLNFRNSHYSLWRRFAGEIFVLGLEK